MNTELTDAQVRHEFIQKVADTDLYKQLLVFIERMLANRAIAEEIVQDTYFKLFRLADPKVVKKPRALLFDAATKLAISFIRRKRRESAIISSSADDPEIEDVPDVVLGPEDTAANEQFVQQLTEVVEKMPSTLKEVFVLRYVRQMSRQQIAEKLQISVNAVEQRQTRALAAARHGMHLRGFGG